MCRSPGHPAVGGEENMMSSIFGSGELFDAATVQRLYPGGMTDYLDRFTASLDSAIQSGFLLAADRDEILELATAMYPGEAMSERRGLERQSEQGVGHAEQEVQRDQNHADEQQ